MAHQRGVKDAVHGLFEHDKRGGGGIHLQDDAMVQPGQGRAPIRAWDIGPRWRSGRRPPLPPLKQMGELQGTAGKIHLWTRGISGNLRTSRGKEFMAITLVSCFKDSFNN
jgi:hypothetical protein